MQQQPCRAERLMRVFGNEMSSNKKPICNTNEVDSRKRECYVFFARKIMPPSAEMTAMKFKNASASCPTPNINRKSYNPYIRNVTAKKYPAGLFRKAPAYSPPITTRNSIMMERGVRRSVSIIPVHFSSDTLYLWVYCRIHVNEVRILCLPYSFSIYPGDNRGPRMLVRGMRSGTAHELVGV